MTRSPLVVSEDDAIASVAELQAGYEITGLPVIDSADRLVGVISQTDLVRLRGSTLPWAGWHGLLVRDLMTRPAKTIQRAAQLDEAARQMTAERVHRLIVVDDRQWPIGIISESAPNRVDLPAPVPPEIKTLMRFRTAVMPAPFDGANHWRKVSR